MSIVSSMCSSSPNNDGLPNTCGASLLLQHCKQQPHLCATHSSPRARCSALRTLKCTLPPTVHSIVHHEVQRMDADVNVLLGGEKDDKRDDMPSKSPTSFLIQQ
jgi:hypothetical protein